MLWKIFLAAAAAVAPHLLPWRLEASTFYHPRSNARATPDGFEDVRFPTSDGLELHGWFIPASPASSLGVAPTVVHVHGNTGDVWNHRRVVGFLADEGFNVLLFDYRGFGASDAPTGVIRRRGLVEDTLAAIDYVSTRADVDPDRVAVFGYSLGAVLGLAAAAERPRVEAVVAYAGFGTWEGVAADKAGPLGHLLISPGFDAVDSAARLGDRPLMLVHGTRDRVVAFKHGEQIADSAEAAGVRSEFLRVDGATHISLATDPAVREAVVVFLARELDVEAE